MWFAKRGWDRSALLKKIDRGRKEFSDVKLAGIDLSESTIGGAQFVGADLQGANFSGAELRACAFRKADLRGADFSGARLFHCDFREALLEGIKTEKTEFQNCHGLAGLPLAVIRESFSECEFQERVQYVLRFLDEFSGSLKSETHKEAVPIVKTVERHGRSANLCLSSGGGPTHLVVPLVEYNFVGSFTLWWAIKFEAPLLYSSCGGPVFESPEVVEELSPTVWTMALPEKVKVIKRRLASLGDTRELLFDALRDPHIRQLRVTQESVQFDLSPFFEPGIGESIEVALNAATRLATEAEGKDVEQQG